MSIEQQRELHDASGLQFRVTFDHFPASRGARERGSGVQLEPDEPASIEITQIELLQMDGPVDLDGVLSAEVLERITQTLEEDLAEELPDDRY